MKRAMIIMFSMCVVMFIGSTGFAALDGIDGHDRYIYPVVRVEGPSGVGSGTVLYSKLADYEEGERGAGFSTYILTNYHVIGDAIKVVEKFDADLGKDVKQEKKSICHVEIFTYQPESTVIYMRKSSGSGSND